MAGMGVQLCLIESMDHRAFKAWHVGTAAVAVQSVVKVAWKKRGQHEVMCHQTVCSSCL